MTSQWRGYSQQEFEIQYNARALVEDCEQIVAENATRSEAFRKASRCELDLRYGPSGRERIDLFKPAEDNAPVVLFVHGGYWRSREKENFAFLAAPLTKSGAMVAIVEYSLCPHVTIDTIVRQLRASCAWLWRHGTEHGANVSRIHLMGHSAGGHLAAVLAATDWPDLNPDLPEDLIKGTICISGLFDLEPLLEHSVNQDLNLDAQSARRNSPIHMQPTTPGPVIFAVGAQESDEFKRQSREMADAWKAHARASTYLEIPDANHFSIVSNLDQPDFVLTRRCLDQIGL